MRRGLSAQYGSRWLIALAAVTPWISAERSYQWVWLGGLDAMPPTRQMRRDTNIRLRRVKPKLEGLVYGKTRNRGLHGIGK